MSNPTRHETVLFVARLTTGLSREGLLQRLRWLEDEYCDRYGRLRSPAMYYPIMTNISWTPFPPTGEVRRDFANLLDMVVARRQRLILVVNGWDGLTTDTLTFVSLLEHYADLITMRVYAADPPGTRRDFWEPNVLHMCKVFNGDMNINATDVPTHLVIEYFRSFNAVAWTMAKKKADREGKPDDYWS